MGCQVAEGVQLKAQVKLSLSQGLPYGQGCYMAESYVNLQKIQSCHQTNKELTRKQGNHGTAGSERFHDPLENCSWPIDSPATKVSRYTAAGRVSQCRHVLAVVQMQLSRTSRLASRP